MILGCGRDFGWSKNTDATAKWNVDYRDELMGNCPGDFDRSTVTERDFLQIEHYSRGVSIAARHNADQSFRWEASRS
jgi:hypothetical protein